MNVALRAGSMILPGSAAIDGPHKPAKLDPDQEQVRVGGLGAIEPTCDVRRGMPGTGPGARTWADIVASKVAACGSIPQPARVLALACRFVGRSFTDRE